MGIIAFGSTVVPQKIIPKVSVLACRYQCRNRTRAIELYLCRRKQLACTTRQLRWFADHQHRDYRRHQCVARNNKCSRQSKNIYLPARSMLKLCGAMSPANVLANQFSRLNHCEAKQHDCAVHGFRVAGPLYGSDEGGAAPDGAGHAWQSISSPTRRSAIPRHRPTCWRPMPNGSRRGPSFSRVVDPGVGGTRPPVILEADGRWYVGPGNGLFELVQRRAKEHAQLGHRLEA